MIQSRRIFTASNVFLTLVLLQWVLPGIGVAVEAAEPGRISLEFEAKLHPEPFSGRVYLFFSNQRGEPRDGPDWFHPQPFVSLDVTDWSPDTALLIDFDDPALKKFPSQFTRQQAQGLTVQAVARFNPLEREVGKGVGNGHSLVYRLPASGPAVLKIDRLVPDLPFPENAWCKLLKVHSEHLSSFHQREVSLKASVTLPASYYQQPQKRYPVIFEIPGFGGTSLHGVHQRPVRERNTLGVEFIRVLLDPNCPLGHHVFANSANNGPCLDALIEEFLPALDAQFRTIASAHGRFLTGHSSGGWSSLWILIHAPETFAGTWSTSPDSVDFRDFQRIHLYRPGENMYREEMGRRRPLARMNGQEIVYYETFSQMEDVLGPGGQLHSFEAVFSPRGENGKPLTLWDRTTGEIDPAVVETWKKYDIRLILEENWASLGPRLQGKLHVFMGDQDTFYLEGATKLLKESLAQLGSDAEIEMLPGRDHMNLFVGGLDNRIEQAMALHFTTNQPQNLQSRSQSANLKTVRTISVSTK